MKGLFTKVWAQRGEAHQPGKAKHLKLLKQEGLCTPETAGSGAAARAPRAGPGEAHLTGLREGRSHCRPGACEEIPVTCASSGLPFPATDSRWLNPGGRDPPLMLSSWRDRARWKEWKVDLREQPEYPVQVFFPDNLELHVERSKPQKEQRRILEYNRPIMIFIRTSLNFCPTRY